MASTNSSAIDAFRTTLDLFDAGLELMRHNLRRAMPTLVGFYEHALKHFVKDVTLTPQERDDLKQLRYVLDLDDSAALEAEATILRTTYRYHLKKAASDQQLSDVEKEKLQRMVDNFAIPEAVTTQIYKEEVKAVVQEAFNEAIA